MLLVERLTKTFPTAQGPLNVLRGVNLALDPGETLALSGESGSGKSTLLHLIAGLDRPDAGAIMMDGQDVARLSDAGRARLRREKIGLVFQQFNLVPSLKVAENMAFQPKLAGRFDPEWQARLTRSLGLEGLEERYPEQLSGGQQQRVAIGRTLAAKPSLILADEPTGNLDEETGDAVIRLCLDLVAETGSALLMVTHSQRLAGLLGRQLHLAAGRIV